MLMATTRMQKIGGDGDDVNKRRVNSGNYSIRLSAGGGVYAKFRVVYGQSRVVCAEWLPFISFVVTGTALPTARTVELLPRVGRGSVPYT